MQAERRMLDTARVNEYLARAGTDLRGAIARDSTLASAWGALSRVRLAAGDVAGAERDARTALAMDAYLDDARSILLSLFGATLMRDSAAAAWRWCERGAAEFPHDAGFIQCQLTLLAEDMSRRPDARMARRLLAEAERIEPPERARAAGQSWFPIYRQMLTAVVLARAGESDSARAMAARAHVAVDGDPVLEIDYQYEDAFLKLVLGESRATLRLLANYLTARPYLCGLVASHPRWRPLRPDPVFQALTRCVIRP